MARKIKFALEMADGVKVRSNLEELRENFDLEKVVGHFLSGKLVEWLSDRYYEDEADAIEAIDKDAPDLRQRLCDALGVEYDGEAEVDVGQLERLNEKKSILRQKTGDESIIANAAQTALTQEDLADLLDMDESTIYLCGESFNIPARIGNKKYVGILGTPKVSIKANSQADLDAKGIVFENVILPWGNETEENIFVKSEMPVATENSVSTAKKMQLTQVFNSVFTQWASFDPDNVWEMYNRDYLFAVFSGHYDYSAVKNRKKIEVNDVQKQILLSNICQGKYTETDLVHIASTEDFTSGWAFTVDSLCLGGEFGNLILPYKEYDSIIFDMDYKGIFSTDKELKEYCIVKNGGKIHCIKMEKLGDSARWIILAFGHSIANYLSVAKNL